jgi:predicted metal-dependent hydrolase
MRLAGERERGQRRFGHGPLLARRTAHGRPDASKAQARVACGLGVSCDDMQLRLRFRREAKPAPFVFVEAGQVVPVEFVRHARARHYVLRVRDDGGLRVTIPRAGTRAGAEEFLHDKRDWIERERGRQAKRMSGRGPWQDGSIVLFRGAECRLQLAERGARLTASFADQSVKVARAAASDLRVPVERHLRALAARELPARLEHFARLHGFEPAGVSIRNQRSRWGSCSPSGHISLNWRLIQLAEPVGDYVLLHELVHLRHLNHSTRFWRELDRLCPWHKEARAWLRKSSVAHPGQPH